MHTIFKRIYVDPLELNGSTIACKLKYTHRNNVTTLHCRINPKIVNMLIKNRPGSIIHLTFFLQVIVFLIWNQLI